MLSIVSIIYIFILTIIYFLKGNIKNQETKLYSIILPVILVGGGLELSLRFLAPYMDNLKWLNDIVAKLFLIYLVFWLSLITLYNVFISFSNKKYKKFRTFLIIYNVVSYFFIGFLFLYIWSYLWFFESMLIISCIYQFDSVDIKL